MTVTAEPTVDVHGPGHLGCATCGPNVEREGGAKARRPVVRLDARGESFKVTQLVGQLFVCSKANGSCCCGWDEKGRMPFDNDLWGVEWQSRRIRDRVHLSFVGCLGPCVVGNSALLVMYGQTFWLKDLNSVGLSSRVYDWIAAMLDKGGVTEAPTDLAAHVWHRYLPASAPTSSSDLAPVLEPIGEGLDPVCLMAVDEATAEHRAEHAGRKYSFCAPGCKGAFLAEPAAYV